MHDAQSLPQSTASFSRRITNRALCHALAARVPTAPVMQSAAITTAIPEGLTSTTNPPTASMIPAANCPGAIARSGESQETWGVFGRSNHHKPSAVESSATPKHNTPVITTEPQYELF